jgi:hypothetical protein
LYLLHVHDGKTYHGGKRESKCFLGGGGGQTKTQSGGGLWWRSELSSFSLSLFPSSSGKNNTTGSAVALKNTSRERNSLSCVVAQLLFALRKPSTKIVSNFLCLCKSFGLSLLALKHTDTHIRSQAKALWQIDRYG